MENSSYKLLNIILVKSFFERSAKIEYASQEFKSDLDINIENQKENNKLMVFLTVNFTAGVKEDIQISSEIKMLGIFEFSPEAEKVIPSDKFGKINGPAIIFPFVREHLSSLSLKAGINHILLPPINFVKLQKTLDNKKND